MTNSQVIKAWMNGHEAEARNMSTDGVRLYSYALLIAKGKEVYDYTARCKYYSFLAAPTGSLGFISMTTSRHVGMAKQALL